MCGSSRDSQQPPFFRSFRMEHMIAHSVRGVHDDLALIFDALY